MRPEYNFGAHTARQIPLERLSAFPEPLHFRSRCIPGNTPLTQASQL